jgi:amidase/aspartyl-tRNA(Asn)/glutamyl-tRNA(Gln) amidotransferase subunit A
MALSVDLKAGEVRAQYQSGALTPVDVLDATLEQIGRVNPAINAMAMVDEAGARAAAEAAARRWAAGRPLGDLDGIPVTVKDSVHTTGMPWRHGAAANAALPMSTWDAPPSARLREAGAVIVGKTTMPDFGMMAAGVSSLYGITRNPWDLGCSTGGSSSGAGAHLAAGIGYGSVGSDIAGSVRLPAAHCGLVALKPTQGRIPHLAPSTMRSAGPMARTTGELIDLYRVISRPDPRDTWSLPPDPDDRAGEPVDPVGLRVGLLTDMGYGSAPVEEVLRVVRDAATALAGAGALIDEVPPPFDENPYPALDRLYQVRARTEWEAIPAERRDQVTPEVVQWAAAAATLSAVQFTRDSEAVMASQARLHEKLSGYDFVISPVIPVLGFPAEAVGPDPGTPLAHCGFTAWFNQTAQPASSICFGMEAGCPVGVQVVGRRFDDQGVLRLTKWLEDHRPFEMRWPVDVGSAVKGGHR